MYVRRLTLASVVSLCMATTMLLALACTAFATLPDNRAFEMVSPVEKGGYSFMPTLAVTDAGGEHLIVDGGAHNALLSNDASWMLETRTPSGWSGAQIGPSPTAEASFVEQREVSLDAVSEDFSRFAFRIGMPSDPRDTTHGMTEYVRTGPTGPFTWVTAPPAPNVPVSEPEECGGGTEYFFCVTNRAVFAGASANLQDVVWGQYHPLLAPPASLSGYPADTHEHGYEVYDSVAGVAQLTGLVPQGSESECGLSGAGCRVPPCGAAMGNQDASGPFSGGFAPIRGAVSGDGSQVLFTSPDPSTYREEVPGCTAPELYVREDGTTTIQVSLSRKAGGDPSGPQEKIYAGSSQEGGRINTVFFTSREELTNDANTGGTDEANNLYAYTMPTGSQPGALKDLTPENNVPGQVSFLAASTNGRLVYFTARSVLAGEPNSQGQSAKAGASNLYLYDASTGHTTFIASGAGLTPEAIGLGYGGQLTSEATPDGQHFAFVSRERITQYNNVGPECIGQDVNDVPVREPGPCSEVYLYTAATGALACVSCSPAGAPPAGSARLPARFPGGFFALGEPNALPLPQAVSDDGSRVFFTSPDQLTDEAPPPKTHEAGGGLAANWEFEPNVYEYESGSAHLITSEAVLLTSTPSGNDVFVDTLRQLTPQDADNTADVYDARVAGGFPQLAPPACSGTSCQGVSAPAPLFATPASVTFNGVGNFPSMPETPQPASKAPKPVKCGKGRVRKHNKCVKRPKAKKSARRKK